MIRMMAEVNGDALAFERLELLMGLGLAPEIEPFVVVDEDAPVPEPVLDVDEMRARLRRLTDASGRRWLVRGRAPSPSAVQGAIAELGR
jgi:hypothetical protein